MPNNQLDAIFSFYTSGIMSIMGDITTLICAIITLLIIAIGFDLLTDYLRDPVNTFGGVKDALAQRQFKNLPAAPGLLAGPFGTVSRSDIEISPLRQRELDIAVGDHDTEEDLYEELKQARRESL